MNIFGTIFCHIVKGNKVLWFMGLQRMKREYQKNPMWSPRRPLGLFLGLRYRIFIFYYIFKSIDGQPEVVQNFQKSALLANLKGRHEDFFSFSP